MANNPNASANLKPVKKGEVRNPKGRTPGVKNWSTIIQSLLADEVLIDKVVKQKPSYWNDLPVKNGANLIAVAMMIRAMGGDKQAAEWLSKTGFKDQLDITSDGEALGPVIVRIINEPQRNIDS